MIISEQIYKLIRQELYNNSIIAYSDSIPTETSYAPFVMYEILDLDPSYAFGKDYEANKVRFNIYANADNPKTATNIGEQIEDLFNRKNNTFIDGTDGKKLICSYKVNDSIDNLDPPKYWLVTGDYVFEGERNIP